MDLKVGTYPNCVGKYILSEGSGWQLMRTLHLSLFSQRNHFAGLTIEASMHGRFSACSWTHHHTMDFHLAGDHTHWELVAKATGQFGFTMGLMCCWIFGGILLLMLLFTPMLVREQGRHSDDMPEYCLCPIRLCPCDQVPTDRDECNRGGRAGVQTLVFTSDGSSSYSATLQK